MGRPVYGLVAANQTYELVYPIGRGRPIGEDGLPGPRIDPFCSDIQIGSYLPHAFALAQLCRGYLKIFIELQLVQIGENHNFAVPQGTHQRVRQITAPNAAGAAGQGLFVHNLSGGIAAVVTIQERALHVSRQVHAKALQTGNAFGDQDEPHSRFLSLTATFVDTTVLSVGTQRNRTHQTGNATAKNRYVHIPSPKAYHSAIEQSDRSVCNSSVLTA